MIDLILINKKQTEKHENEMKDLFKQSMENQQKQFAKIFDGLNSKIDAVIQEKEQLKVEMLNLKVKENRNNNSVTMFTKSTNDVLENNTTTMSNFMNEFCTQQKQKEIKVHRMVLTVLQSY